MAIGHHCLCQLKGWEGAPAGAGAASLMGAASATSPLAAGLAVVEERAARRAAECWGRRDRDGGAAAGGMRRCAASGRAPPIATLPRCAASSIV